MTFEKRNVLKNIQSNHTLPFMNHERFALKLLSSYVTGISCKNLRGGETSPRFLHFSDR